MKRLRLTVKAWLHAGVFAVLRFTTVSPMLRSRNKLLRHFLFETIFRSGYNGLLVSTPDPLTILLHHPLDRGPGRDLFVRGTQDFGKLELALRLLRDSGVTLPTRLADIGANIGTICIPAVKRGLFASAVAVEAVPDILRLLTANVVLNDLSGAIAITAAAVSDRDGETIEMAVNRANQGDNRIAAAGEEFSGAVRVPTTTLDTLLADSAEPTLIWMDIQGYEGIALRGGTRILSRRPPMVLEFCPALMRDAGSYDALCAAVREYRGFYDLGRPDTRQALDRLDALRDRLGFRGNFTDILLVP